MNHNQMQALIRSIVRKVLMEYPDVEADDLESQAWLIVTERIGEYDKSKASLSTYLHHKVYGGLRDYIRRVVLKELHLNGMRSHSDWQELSSPDISNAMEAKLTIEHILENATEPERKILELMMDGLAPYEVAQELGVSRQYVSQVLMKLRCDNG